MKKLIIALLLCTCLISPAFAWDAGGWDSGKFSAGLIGTGMIPGGVTTMVTGSAAIPLNYSIVKKIMGGASDQAGTLADGIQGQVIKIILTEKAAGNYVLTPTTKTGFASITFNTMWDQATLLFVDNAIGWVIVGENGTSLAY